MSKILHLSSEGDVKYITFGIDDKFLDLFHKFLSEIGISRRKRKNIFKEYFVYTKGGKKGYNYTDTLQLIYNDDKTITIEIFTGQSVVIVGIHYKNSMIGQKIGKNLDKYFEFKQPK